MVSKAMEWVSASQKENRFCLRQGIPRDIKTFQRSVRAILILQGLLCNLSGLANVTADSTTTKGADSQNEELHPLQKNFPTEAEPLLHADWGALLEEITENNDEEKNTEQWEEVLSELSENPIPLNTATREMLESIPFLTENQVESLSYYIYRYGPLVNLSELLLVENMDAQTLRWLTPFVDLGAPLPFPVALPPMKKALDYGKQEIRFRMGRCLQQKTGFIDSEDSTDHYLGDPLQLSFHYGFNYKNKMQWGLVLEKDAGEKIWNKSSGGPDYLSFHFLLKDQKRFKSLIIGDYQLRFGQGLLCSGNFSLGKSIGGTIIEMTGASLSRHFSTSESNYFRGVAANFILKPFVQQTTEVKGKFGIELAAFASFRNLDANVQNDTFTTINSTGLHRTEKENALRNQLKLSTLGSHLELRSGKVQFGMTILTYRFSACSTPEWAPYNSFYFRGKQGVNVSTDFRRLYRGLLFFGEFAVDEKLHKALIGGVSFKPFSRMSMSMLGRNYSPEYNAFYGAAFSEGGSIKNEQGIFVCGEIQIIRRWRLNFYYDLFRFPWLKYGISSPSDGQDLAIQATCLPSRSSQLVIRFKTKSKSKNHTEGKKPILVTSPTRKNQLRLQFSQVQGAWGIKTTLDANNYQDTDGQTNGVSLSQEVNCKPTGKHYSLAARYALFNTDTYNNRIYSWEKDLPGSFAMPALYGKGSRYALMTNYDMTPTLRLQIKIGHSAYSDRQQVGTGSELVQGNRLTDIRALIRWKF
jgi:hypothetical protein